jgi:hypothetical protein
LVSYGQAGIAVRDALARGDGDAAAMAVADLDDAHRIEILLGAVIRRADGVCAQHWADGDVNLLCKALVLPGNTDADDRAIAYVLRRIIGERWRPDGPDAAQDPQTMDDVAQALAAGCGGLALLRRMKHRRLYRVVSDYYSIGSIHALGLRPLLILADS